MLLTKVGITLLAIFMIALYVYLIARFTPHAIHDARNRFWSNFAIDVTFVLMSLFMLILTFSDTLRLVKELIKFLVGLG